MTDPHTLADALLAAERERTALVPFTKRNPFLDVSDFPPAQPTSKEVNGLTADIFVSTAVFTLATKHMPLGMHLPGCPPVFVRRTKDQMSISNPVPA